MTTLGIVDDHASHAQADQGKRHCDSMIVVGLDHGARQFARADHKVVSFNLGKATQPANLGSQGPRRSLSFSRRFPTFLIRLFPSANTHATASARAASGASIHIDIDRTQRRRADQIHAVSRPPHIAAHRLEYVQESQIRLGGSGRNSLDADRTGRDRGRHQRIHRRRRVGFDPVIGRSIAGRIDLEPVA